MKEIIFMVVTLFVLVTLLIRYGACANVKDCNGSTPLHLGKSLCGYLRNGVVNSLSLNC